MIDLDIIAASYPPILREQQFRRSLLREYLQYKMLKLIFDSEYGRRLVFIGGTALRLIYDNQRFSEDLDFDDQGLSPEEFEAMAETARRGLEREGYHVETDFIHKGGHRCYLKFLDILYTERISPHRDEKLLIQIDATPQRYQFEPDKKLLNFLEIFTTISVAPVSLLLSQKIYAALDRKRAKGRDFFDITYLSSRTKPDYRYLQEKVGITDAEALRDKLIRLCATLDFPQLARDVKEFLFRPEDARRIELFGEFIKEAEL